MGEREDVGRVMFKTRGIKVVFEDRRMDEITQGILNKKNYKMKDIVSLPSMRQVQQQKQQVPGQKSQMDEENQVCVVSWVSNASRTREQSKSKARNH